MPGLRRFRRACAGQATRQIRRTERIPRRRGVDNLVDLLRRHLKRLPLTTNQARLRATLEPLRYLLDHLFGVFHLEHELHFHTYLKDILPVPYEMRNVPRAASSLLYIINKTSSPTVPVSFLVYFISVNCYSPLTRTSLCISFFRHLSVLAGELKIMLVMSQIVHINY